MAEQKNNFPKNAFVVGIAAALLLVGVILLMMGPEERAPSQEKLSAGIQTDSSVSEKLPASVKTVDPHASEFRQLGSMLDKAASTNDQAIYDAVVHRLEEIHGEGDHMTKLKALRMAIFISQYRGNRAESERFLKMLAATCISDSDIDRSGRAFAKEQLAKMDVILDKYLSLTMDRRIQKLMAHRKYAEAIELAKEMLAKANTEPVKKEARWLLIKAAIRLGKKELALEHLALLRQNTQDRQEISQIDELRIQCVSPQEAISIYRQMIDEIPAGIDPGSYVAGLGKLLSNQGQNDEAVEVLRNYLEKYGDKGEHTGTVKLRLGTLTLRGDLRETVELFDGVKKAVDPENPLARTATSYTAKAYRYHKQYDKASKLYVELATNYPYGPEGKMALVNLREMERRMGKEIGSLATEELKDYLALFSSRGRIQEKLAEFEKKRPKSKMLEDAHIHAAEYLFSQGKLEESRKAAETTLQKYPETPNAQRALYVIGRSLYKERKYEEASGFFEKMLNSVSDSDIRHDKVNLHLAICRQKTGKLDEAIEVYKRIIHSRDAHVAKLAKQYVKALQFQKERQTKSAGGTAKKKPTQ